MNLIPHGSCTARHSRRYALENLVGMIPYLLFLENIYWSISLWFLQNSPEHHKSYCALWFAAFLVSQAIDSPIELHGHWGELGRVQQVRCHQDNESSWSQFSQWFWFCLVITYMFMPWLYHSSEYIPSRSSPSAYFQNISSSSTSSWEPNKVLREFV